MLLPPEQIDWTTRVDPTKLKNRKFNTGKSAKAPPGVGKGGGATWTETLDEKRKRLENEVMGVQAPAATAGKPGTPADKNDADEEMASRIKQHTVRVWQLCSRNCGFWTFQDTDYGCPFV
jgi:hypothetical protein